jgi:hypothetical protein
MSGSLGAVRAGISSLASRRLSHSEASSSSQPAARLHAGAEVRCGTKALKVLFYPDLA